MSVRSIMLIDDNDDDNYIATRVIRSSRVVDDPERQVFIVKDGASALDFLTRGAAGGVADHYFPPTVILLDINMPIMNGWDFLERFHTLPESVQDAVVIVMLTSSTRPGERERAMKYPPVAGYCTKPITAEILHAAIGRASAYRSRALS